MNYILKHLFCLGIRVQGACLFEIQITRSFVIAQNSSYRTKVFHFKPFQLGISKIHLRYKDLYKNPIIQVCSRLCIVTQQMKVNYKVLSYLQRVTISCFQRGSVVSSWLHIQVSHPTIVCIQVSLAVHETRKEKLAKNSK